MMKIIKILTVIIIILTVALCANKLLPQSKEIDQMEIIKVVGLDYENDKKDLSKATVSFIMEKESDETEDGKGGKSKTQEVMKYSARSANEALNQMQFYTDKFIEGSHIKTFLIGEKTAKEDIDKALDEISKDKEIRLSSHIYLVKDMKAYDFLENVVSLEYELGEKLSSMEKKIDGKTILKPLTISELLAFKLSEPYSYVIPIIYYMSGDDRLEVTKESGTEQEEKLKKQFDFWGYGIMKENKLVDFFEKDQAITYNMLNNTATSRNLEINTDEGEIISFEINNISCIYDFDVSNDGDICTAVIKVKFKSNFYEIYNEDDLTCANKLQEYQKLQEEKVKNEIEEVLQKTKDLNADVLNIGGKLKVKHPYKYKKVENIFKKSYSTLKFDVQVQAQIERTFDVIKTHK